MVKQTVYLLVILLVLSIAGVAAAGADEEKFIAAAHQITDEMLTGLKENNYQKFSANFDGKMKENLTETQFRQLQANIKANIGDCISRDFVRLEKKGEYRIAIYHAAFSREPQSVVVQTVFSQIDGKVYVSGFWLDSPKLRK